MADSKITALAAISTVDPTADPLVIVDVSDTSMAASGTTKKITSNQILGAGGTATLASATITGDLTVDTSTLKVDSANNRVGIGTASPAKGLEINQSANAFTTIGTGEVLRLIGDDGNVNSRITEIGFGSGPTGATYPVVVLGAANTSVSGFGTKDLYFATRAGISDVAPLERYRIASDGVATWSNVGGVAGTAMTLNSTGLGVGVTPSAWATYKAVSVGGIGASVFGLGSSQAGVAQGAFFNNGSGSGWAYSATSQVPAYYLQINGEHRFHNAVSGTAGNQITAWTQAMTLDASGNLLVGTTGLNATWNTRLTLSSDSGTTRWAVGPYSTATNFVISGASGGGVYLNGTAATSWTSASDERLKDIIEPIGNAVAKVGSLRAVIGKFKNDALNTRKSFLIAQDVQSVLPEAVDASNPDQLGVAYTDVIPLLVAAIKELTARVEALEA